MKNSAIFFILLIFSFFLFSCNFNETKDPGLTCNSLDSAKVQKMWNAWQNQKNHPNEDIAQVLTMDPGILRALTKSALRIKFITGQYIDGKDSGKFAIIVQKLILDHNVAKFEYCDFLDIFSADNYNKFHVKSNSVSDTQNFNSKCPPPLCDCCPLN